MSNFQMYESDLPKKNLGVTSMETLSESSKKPKEKQELY